MDADDGADRTRADDGEGLWIRHRRSWVGGIVAIKTDRHSASWIESFAKEVSKLHEVVEFYRMSGETDYLLRVVVPDIAGYDRFYKKLISVADLSDVSSSFAMEQIKFTTALPVEESSL